MSEPFEPINLRCPECKAEPLEECRYGGDVGYHLSRFDAAEEWRRAANSTTEASA